MSKFRLFNSTEIKAIFSRENFLKIIATALLSTAILLLFFICIPAGTDSIGAELTKFSRWIKFALAIAWTTLFFSWLGLIKWQLRAPILAIVLIPNFVFWHIACVFKMPYSYGLLTDILETNFNEAMSFFDWKVAGTILFAIIAISALTFVLGKLKICVPAKLQKIAIFGVPAILFATLFTPIETIVYLERIARIAQTDVRDYFGSEREILQEIKKIESREIPENSVPADENAPIVFLHLGESVRADHAPFNGYSRNTMPLVNAELLDGNVVSFSRCTSYSISTRISAFAVLTPLTSSDPIVRHGSLFPWINAAGLKTIAFFSAMPNGGSFYDSALTCLTAAVQEKHFEKENSDVLLPTLLEKIRAGTQNQKPFYFYYGEGAHVPATRYNREKYSKFVPAATTYVEDQTRVNAYDNCLVATDDFIGNIIAELRDKNAIYIYVADHGDLLGEDDFWSRNQICSQRPELRRVLFFVWASKKFQKTFPQKWEILKSHAANFECVSHDYIYHTVFGALGMTPTTYVPALDLFSSEAQAFPREIPKFFNGLQFEGKSLKFGGRKADKIAGEKQLADREKRQRERKNQN